jgi:hypothetical protein
MAITNAPSTPTKRSTPKTPGSSVPRETHLTPRDETRKDNLMGVMSAGSMLALMRGQYADAGAISAHGPKVARELVLLGKSNEGVGKVLDLLAQAGPYTGIVFATLPLLAQLAVNHGRIDAAKVSGIPGVKSKDALAMEVQAELAEEELNQRKWAQETADNVARLQAEMERPSNVPE